MNYSRCSDEQRLCDTGCTYVEEADVNEAGEEAVYKKVQTMNAGPQEDHGSFSNLA